MAKTKRPQLTRSKLGPDAKRRLIQQYLAARDEGRNQYAKSDRLLDELLAGGWTPKDQVELSGCTAELIDNFASKHKHYKTVGVSRFEVRVSHDER